MILMLDLTQFEHTPAGQFLGRLYYQTEIIDLIHRENRYGYPHNGGKHTLKLLRIEETDIRAFFDVIEEEYPEGHRFHEGAVAFLKEGRIRLANNIQELAKLKNFIPQKH